MFFPLIWLMVLGGIDHPSDIWVLQRGAQLEWDGKVLFEFRDHLLVSGSFQETSRFGQAIQKVGQFETGLELVAIHPRQDSLPEDVNRMGDTLFVADGVCMMLLPIGQLDSLRGRTDLMVGYVDPQGIRNDSTKTTPHVRLAVNSLVQEMVDSATDAYIMGHWTGLISLASTRYSLSSGCETAAQGVFDLFQSFGLSVAFQPHTSGHAPNVIGTQIGTKYPDKVYIVIGHLDDLPSSGAAPGADDNASGSATLVALAEIMSQYEFENTVKFIAVTGEEQGLHGSSYYAEQAQLQGEDIQAVLNADMTGWEGDGNPTIENLDLNYNATSQWLGELFQQLAQDYNTGCVVDAFSCPSLTASDHAPFWSRGFAAVCGITDNEGYCSHSGHYPYYHQSSDTVANCGDPTFFYGAVRAYLATLAHLANPCSAEIATSVQAQAEGDNQIRITFQSPAAGMSYEIMRAPGSCDGADKQLVGTTTETTFLDTTVSGGVTYQYSVVTFDGECRSVESECVEASTSGACFEPPQFAGLEGVLNLQTTECGIELSWSQAIPFCSSGVVYNVFRSEQAPVTPDPAYLIASCVEELSYIDTAIESNTLYFYLIQAEDAGTGGSGLCQGGWPSTNSNYLEGFANGPDNILSSDDVEEGNVGWNFYAGSGDPGNTDPWMIVDTASNSASHSWFCEDEPQQKHQVLEWDQPIDVAENSQPEFSFWHRFDFESGWDGGVMEYRLNGQDPWVDILDGVGPVLPNSERFLKGEYNTTLRVNSANALSQRDAWSGANGSTFQEVVVDCADFEGYSIEFRWVVGCDSSEGSLGWWLDDFEFIEKTSCAGTSVCEWEVALTQWGFGLCILDLLECSGAPFGTP